MEQCSLIYNILPKEIMQLNCEYVKWMLFAEEKRNFKKGNLIFFFYVSKVFELNKIVLENIGKYFTFWLYKMAKNKIIN